MINAFLVAIFKIPENHCYSVPKKNDFRQFSLFTSYFRERFPIHPFLIEMAGTLKLPKMKKKLPARKKRTSRSVKAGITFPVGRIQRKLKAGKYTPRVGLGASVYMAAVLEYLVAEVMELAGNAAQDNKKVRIVPRHIQLAVRCDTELNELLDKVTIAQGGVLPFIADALLPKSKIHAKPKPQAAPSAVIAAPESPVSPDSSASVESPASTGSRGSTGSPADAETKPLSSGSADSDESTASYD